MVARDYWYRLNSTFDKHLTYIDISSLLFRLLCCCYFGFSVSAILSWQSYVCRPDKQRAPTYVENNKFIIYPRRGHTKINSPLYPWSSLSGDVSLVILELTLKFYIVCWDGGGGICTQNHFIWKAPPRGPSPYPFYIPFFVYLHWKLMPLSHSL